MTDEEIIETFKYCTENRTPEACVECRLFGTCRANPHLLEELVVGVLTCQQARLKALEGKHDKQ